MMNGRIIGCPPARAAGERGITLIEVLVAMVLLGVGMLGLAGLQLRGMQVNQGAAFRSQAAILAADLADRMRADSANAAAYVVSNFTATSSAAGLPQPLVDWQGLLIQTAGQGASLPSGALTVTYDAPTSTATILVTWDDSRATQASNPAAPVTMTAATVTTATLGQFYLVTGL